MGFRSTHSLRCQRLSGWMPTLRSSRGYFLELGDTLPPFIFSIYEYINLCNRVPYIHLGFRTPAVWIFPSRELRLECSFGDITSDVGLLPIKQFDL